MKKLFALILSIFYLLSCNICFAFNEMYYLKNIDDSSASAIVKEVFTDKEYNIKKENPFWAVSNKDTKSYAVIIFQQSGQDLYYYIQSDDNGKKINKTFLKNLKKQNIEYDKYTNATHLEYFSNLAQKTLSGEKTTYSFDPVQNISQSPKSSFSNPKVLHGTVKKIGKDTVIQVYLQHAINTATANKGDNIIAVLKSDWVADSYVIAPQGSVLYGSLIEAEHAKIGMRNGKVTIDFNKLVTPAGKTYNLKTQNIDFEVTNDGKVKASFKKVATAAALGALAGLGLALLSGDNYGASTAIAAGVAGGVALVSTVAAKGVDAEIPSYTELEVIVDEDIKAVVNY